jgi:hypothetical protein
MERHPCLAATALLSCVRRGQRKKNGVERGIHGMSKEDTEKRL